MSTQSAAALLDAAIFTMQRARAELGAPPAPSAEETPVQQSALGRFVARFEALDASDYTAAEQAKAYEETAGVLRRRATRVDPTPEALAETESRARYFELRARHKRAGEPMPYALRTANEGLGYVDALRLELVDLVELVQLIARDEIRSFVGALEQDPIPLDRVTADNRTANAAEAFDAFVTSLGQVIGMLGVYRDGQTGKIELVRYRKLIPTSDAPELTEWPAGPPAPPMDPVEAHLLGRLPRGVLRQRVLQQGVPVNPGRRPSGYTKEASLVADERSCDVTDRATGADMAKKAPS